MSKQVKWRRGTTAEHATFLGAIGEVTVDTTKDTLVVHDGVTLGGHSLPEPRDWDGFTSELYAQAEIVDSGLPDALGASQRVDALKALFPRVFRYIADIQDVKLGDRVVVEDYAEGNNAGNLFFRVVAGGTGVADGGKYINLLGGLQLEQNLKTDYSIKYWGARGDETTDNAAAINNCFKYCIKKYDPTKTVMDGNNFTYRGKQLSPTIPSGIFLVNSTLDLSYSNDWAVKGGGRSSVIRWGGAINGMIFDVRASSYGSMSNLVIDGAHKALTFIQWSGTGTYAPASKGNVTANIIHGIHFWNQVAYKGTLNNPLACMLNTICIDNPATFYNSMDDSEISSCRFSSNELNYGFGLGISSSAISVNDCQFFTASSVLALNGANFYMNNCMNSLYSGDGSQINAIVTLADGGRYGAIELHGCYLESNDYYASGDTARMFVCQGSQQTRVNNISVFGGLYSTQVNNAIMVSLHGNVAGAINILYPSVQENKVGFIYAPKCFVTIKVNSGRTEAGEETDEVGSWLVTEAKGRDIEMSTPDYTVKGSTLSGVLTTATVGNVSIPHNLEFFSLADAVNYVGDSKSVEIYVTKDTVVSGQSTGGELTINGGGRVINCAGFTVTDSSKVTIINAHLTVQSFGLINNGVLVLQGCTIDGPARINNGGKVVIGGASTVTTTGGVTCNNDGKVTLELDTCTFQGGNTVVTKGTLGACLLMSTTGTLPITGGWERGTEFKKASPTAGEANMYYATTTGVGVAAAWRANGTLSVT